MVCAHNGYGECTRLREDIGKGRCRRTAVSGCYGRGEGTRRADSQGFSSVDLRVLAKPGDRSTAASATSGKVEVLAARAEGDGRSGQNRRRRWANAGCQRWNDRAVHAELLRCRVRRTMNFDRVLSSRWEHVGK